MGISIGKQKGSESKGTSEYGPEMWVPGQRGVARGLRQAIMPIFGAQFGTSPTVRTLEQLARGGASKETGAMLNELSEMKGLSQPALAKITGQLPTKAMEASASVYQDLYKVLLGLATQFGLTPAGTKGKSTQTGSGGGGFSFGVGLMGGGSPSIGNTTNVMKE
jgi:hypothetical protein